MAFDEFRTEFPGKIRKPETWRITESRVYKNEKLFIDLLDVDTVSYGSFAVPRSSPQHRTLFATKDGSAKIVFTAGLSSTRNTVHDDLIQEILVRYQHYRPDGIIDPAGDATTRRMRAAFGLLYGVGGVAILSSPLWLNNGSELARAPGWQRLLLGLIFVLSSAISFSGVRSRQVTAGKFAAGEPTGKRLIEWGLVLLVLALLVAGLSGPVLPYLQGHERIELSTGQKVWVDPDFDTVNPSDQIVVFGPTVGYTERSNTVLRVAAVEGQLINSDGREISVDGIRYRYASDFYRFGEWSVRVPPDHAFLLADSPVSGLDSREAGPVPFSEIIGVLK